MTDTTPTEELTPPRKPASSPRRCPTSSVSTGKTIVVKYGGNAMTEEHLKQLLRARWVLLQAGRPERGRGHGGGPQIENLLARVGKKGEFVQGMRVTDAETMEVVEMVLGGQVNKDVVNLINHAGGKAVGPPARTAPSSAPQKLNAAEQGQPRRSDRRRRRGRHHADRPVADRPSLEAGGFIPVIAPIGVGKDGETYNINADVVAGKIAEVLKAEKLVLLTNTPGVLDKAAT